MVQLSNAISGNPYVAARTYLMLYIYCVSNTIIDIYWKSIPKIDCFCMLIAVWYNDVPTWETIVMCGSTAI